MGVVAVGASMWPVGDREWVARYRTSMADRNVPALALEERERELAGTVREMKLSAAELFGDAEELASEDAAELATVEEEVRTSLGGGLQPALKEVGGMLVGLGVVASLVAIIRSGWSIDIDTALVLVGASLLVAFLGWVIARALFSSGRSAAAVAAGVGAGAVAVAGIACAAKVGAGHVAASDVPLPLLVVGLLVPGIATLVIADRMPQQELRENWDDSQWLRRFRGGLRARLVPAVTARGHVAEIEQTLAAGGMSAYSEFGHPLILAHEVARADRTARRRFWAMSTIAAVGTPLCLAVLVMANQSWGMVTIPVAVAFFLMAAGAFLVGWDRRPWTTQR
ncbi:hypothetical protein JOE61_003375 [Nocardioides salarius]|uniref:Uncharacterized protein n=1 Tax=Nocardioides salarius TaxID=374513 RepID=A0ABS2MEE5_9ACTN|nr:hypothetical protein [Nocardioides salarius]MBM7509561.1 hypothetical protein [Nocardioides salarius]